MMKNKWSWGAVGAAFLIGYPLVVNEVGLTVWDRFWSESRESAYEQRISEFNQISLITRAELGEQGVRFTYYTCNQPDLEYTVHYIVNGRLMKTEGPFNPHDYGSLGRCFTWTGDWHDDLDIESGDDVVVRWHFGTHGEADLEIIVK